MATIVAQQADMRYACQGGYCALHDFLTRENTAGYIFAADWYNKLGGKAAAVEACHGRICN